MDPISGAGPIKRTAVSLLYGWGYNFYRAENQLRADDLLIRNKAGGILAAARAHLGALEAAWRREFLPPPSREQPFPDRASVAQAQRIARSGALIEQVATTLQTAQTPTSDKIWLRHRTERGLLETLQAIDTGLIDAAIGFHDLVIVWDQSAVADPAIETVMATALNPLKQILAERAERLTLLV